MKGATNVTGEMALPTGTGAITSGPGGGSVAIGESDRIRENKKDVEIVGIKDATYKIIDRNLTFTENYGTGSTDWYTLRANAVRIKVVNGVGTNKVLEALTILGKIVWRHSGEQGFIHDAFSDYEDILRNGERLFKLENNMICTFPQVNQLADYWWKYYRTKKHIYQVTIAGTQHQYKIGSWYELQIGGPGEVEYIDSTVMLTGKTVERGAASIGRTTLTFREVEENWKADSNAEARFNAASNPGKIAGRGNQLTVASNDYVGVADYYCDGTNDEEEIQAAIDRLSDMYGGGEIYLSPGEFKIDTTAIEIKDNIVLAGAGDQTIIECANFNSPISVTGDNTKITNVKIIDYFDSNRTAIDITGSGCTIDSVSVLGAGIQRARILLGSNCKLINSYIANIVHVSFYTSSFGILVSGNVFVGCQRAVTTTGGGISGVVISNNHILESTSDGISIVGVFTGILDNIVISNNTIKNTVSTSTNNGGIRVAATDSVAKNIQIIGNAISGGSTNGILLSTFAINLGGFVYNCLISGNHVYDNAKTGILIATSVVNNTVVSGNRATNNTTANYTDAGTNTTATGNDFT